MDIKIIKKLGSGVMGTVFLIESGGYKYIYKIEKYKPDKKPLQHAYERQIDFDQNVAKFHPDKFLTLKSWGILSDCKHKQPIPDWIRGKFRKELGEKNKLPTCYFLIYAPVLKYTFADLQDKIYSTPRLWYRAFYQLIDQVNIMHIAGYRHCDIHHKNIMSDGRNFRLIDYGMVSHKKYPENKEDKNLSKFDVPSDIIMCIIMMAVNPVADYCFKNKIKWPPYPKFIKAIKQHNNIAKFMQYIPRSGISAAYRNELTWIIVMLHDYEFYKKCLDLTAPEYAKFKQPRQINIDLILYCIKHSGDREYSAILRQFRQYVR